jgi:hypothetical protein
MLDHFLQIAKSRFQTEEVPPLDRWAAELPVILDGQPFSFKRHEYLLVPYQDTHPYQVEMKATQVGCTCQVYP